MRSSNARQYDEYERLKEEKKRCINKDNAHSIFDASKKELLTTLKKIDIRNIRQVEDVHLIVALLTGSAAYLLAKEKACEQNIAFDDALNLVGSDDLQGLLFNSFKKDADIKYLHKFYEIDKKYKPAKQGWAGLNAKMLRLHLELKKEMILTNVSAYRDHLAAKIKALEMSMATDNPVLSKTRARYQALHTLEQRIKDKPVLQLPDINYAKRIINICIDNQPDWLERTFLQKLTDVLSLGFKPLLSTLISKEKKLLHILEDSVDSIQENHYPSV